MPTINRYYGWIRHDAIVIPQVSSFEKIETS